MDSLSPFVLSYDCNYVVTNCQYDPFKVELYPTLLQSGMILI